MNDKQKEQIFRKLIDDKILIRMSLTDPPYETLTMVTGVDMERGKSRFLLDCPKGFKEMVNGNEQLQMRFEFTDKEKIKYSFTTTGGHIISNDMVLAFPETIERHQRRRHFRIEAPNGTVLSSRNRDRKLALGVINISLGGALIALSAKKDAPSAAETNLKMGGRLHDIDLVLPFRDEKQIVDIRKLLIVRVEAPSDNHQWNCGLQITHISPLEKKRLNELIYEVQREMLRRRHLFG